MFMEKIGDIANSLWAKIFLGFIAVTFVLSGVGGYVFFTNDIYVAKVNGEKVSQQYFYNMYELETTRLRDSLGDKFSTLISNPNFAKELRADILNRIINEILLRQYAQNLDLTTSQSQIEKNIVLTPEFQSNGKFNNDLYLQTLANNNLTPEQYAQLIAVSLTTKSMSDGIINSSFSVPALNNIITNAYLQTRQVRIADIPSTNFVSQAKITPEEIKNYYTANQASFNLPEQVKVQYIDLTQNDVKKNVKVSDVEIAQYYQEHKDQYEQRQLAHIQVPNLEEANAIYAQLQQGANFATLAKEKSVDTLSAKNGGDLSWSRAGVFPKAFEEAVDSLQVGEYSKPVKVEDSYHIIKLVAEKVQSLSEAREDIKAKLYSELATKAFFDTEKQLSEKAFENLESLEAIAKEFGLSVKTTDTFTRDNIPAELNYPNVLSVIFNSDVTKGDINSEAISVGNQHSIVVRVVNYQEAHQQPLDKVSADIEKILKQQQAQSLAFKQAEKIASDLNAQNKVEGVSFGKEETVSYLDNDSTNLDFDFVKAILALPKPQTDKPSYYAVKTAGGDSKIVEIIKVSSMTINAEERQLFYQQLAQINTSVYSELVVKYLREKADIEINQNLLNPQSPNP